MFLWNHGAIISVIVKFHCTTMPVAYKIYTIGKHFCSLSSSIVLKAHDPRASCRRRPVADDPDSHRDRRFLCIIGHLMWLDSLPIVKAPRRH